MAFNGLQFLSRKPEAAAASAQQMEIKCNKPLEAKNVKKNQ